VSDEKKPFSLIHIDAGDLSKPINTLIKKISNAIGIVFEPRHIKHVAEAEAVADRIRTTAQIEKVERLQRVTFRFLAEQMKQQENIESIITKAVPEVSEQAKPEQVEDDWIANFFDKCRLISDEEMQGLWAKILAGEANSPGKYVKRTINFLASMDKGDALLFSHLCRFNFFLAGATHPLIYDVHEVIYKSCEVNFGNLSHLESIGLIHFGLSFSEYTVSFSGQPSGGITYFGKPVWIEFPNAENCTFRVGKVMLTLVGQQLASVCGAQPVDGFVEYVTAKWKSFGYKTDPPIGPPMF
jgi:hypothetical protein